MADTYAELVARVEALESGVTLGQLPFAAMQRKLESDWQPDAVTLLGSKSITPDMLPFQIVGGLVTLTWPGGSQLTNAPVVPHGLGAVPTAIAALTASHNLIVRYTTPTATTITFEGTTRDLSSPVAGTTQNFYWMAVLIG